VPSSPQASVLRLLRFPSRAPGLSGTRPFPPLPGAFLFPRGNADPSLPSDPYRTHAVWSYLPRYTSVNTHHDDDQTPLHVATSTCSGHTSLINCGAIPNMKSEGQEVRLFLPYSVLSTDRTSRRTPTGRVENSAWWISLSQLTLSPLTIPARRLITDNMTESWGARNLFMLPYLCLLINFQP